VFAQRFNNFRRLVDSAVPLLPNGLGIERQRGARANLRQEAIAHQVRDICESTA
jgi:hypothetical protein